MPQKDMPMELAERIIRDHVYPGTHVNLQGEGEPVLAKHFWNIVDLVWKRGGLPHIITNAGYTITDKMAADFKRYFYTLAVSLDTTDVARAESIGRYNVQRVMDNIIRFRDIIGPERVTIMAVGLSPQDVDGVVSFARKHRLPQVIVQSLQTKNDYMINYEVRHSFSYHFRCRYLEENVMTFFNVDGVEMPCCFIKDVSHYSSAEALRQDMQKNIVPLSCKGCRYIMHSSEQQFIFRG